MNPIKLFITITKLIKRVDEVYNYIFKKNNLDEQNEMFLERFEKMDEKIQVVALNCKAIDSKVDSIFKMKKKFK